MKRIVIIELFFAAKLAIEVVSTSIGKDSPLVDDVTIPDAFPCHGNRKLNVHSDVM